MAVCALQTIACEHHAASCLEIKHLLHELAFVLSLSSTPLLIPNFFALAGTRSGEGAILTRDPEAGKAEVVALGTAQLGGESWFVAVTRNLRLGRLQRS
jgi:hypothetical protein